jgi:hypothetical protein
MRCRPFLVATILSLLAVGSIGIAHGAGTGELSPAAEADVVAISDQIGAFTRDLERLRRFMGAPKANELDIGIRSAIPRDLYFQALTLWENTDRLLLEVMRLHEQPPPTPSDGIGLQDVLSRIRDARQMLSQVIRELQIAPSDGSTPGEGVSTADIFNAILDLNRQLNLLLERHTSPSDVYKEITLAMGYSARLLARYPDAIRIPEEPLFEPDQRPKDVYLRLIECLQSVVRIFDKLGLAILKIDPSRTDLDSLQPSDVYLVASMIVSQLDFLYKHLGIAKPPPQPVYPGLKFPAHSYQRAGILQAQLQQLERLLVTDPTVITSPDPPKPR